MFKELNEINSRPAPFQFYTAEELWTNEYTSKQMLEYHLDEAIDVSSRNKRFIERSVEWIISHYRIDEKSTIADFGCGPGLYATKMAEKGASVTGIDFSESSINYAMKVTLDKYTIIEKSQTRVVYNWLQPFSQESVRKEFEESGFQVDSFYSNVAGDPFDPDSTEFAISARKS